jgi:hypothetical protein
MRHTHATLALAAGVHPKVVSERLGHASVAFTLDTYSHAIPAMQETAADLVASLVFEEGSVAVTAANWLTGHERANDKREPQSYRDKKKKPPRKPSEALKVHRLERKEPCPPKECVVHNHDHEDESEPDQAHAASVTLAMRMGGLGRSGGAVGETPPQHNNGDRGTESWDKRNAHGDVSDSIRPRDEAWRVVARRADRVSNEASKQEDACSPHEERNGYRDGANAVPVHTTKRSSARNENRGMA